jgi:hypothetical protein
MMNVIDVQRMVKMNVDNKKNDHLMLIVEMEIKEKIVDHEVLIVVIIIINHQNIDLFHLSIVIKFFVVQCVFRKQQKKTRLNE